MLENIDMKTWWMIGATASVVLIGALAWLVAFISSIKNDEENGSKKSW